MKFLISKKKINKEKKNISLIREKNHNIVKDTTEIENVLISK